MVEIIPTRGAARALADERKLVEAGFGFLDEKRMLLAATLLAELAEWKKINGVFSEKSAQALETMKNAVARHGFEGLRLYPAKQGEAVNLGLETSNFLGIRLMEEPDFNWLFDAPLPAVDASYQAELCRKTFGELVVLSTRLAARAENIRKLSIEYRKTERRARALENVILPETVSNLKKITDYLDEADQEEAIRNRNAAIKS